MKKIALLMALLMLVLSLAACGGEKNDPENTAGTGSGSETTTGTVPTGSEGTCEHQYEQEVLSEASCDKAGVLRYVCTLCEYSYDEGIAALGHDGSGASCLEPSTCANCGEVVEEAWGHKDENGICANCGISMSGAEAPGDSEATEAEE